ncbi:MAG: DUF4442 domain-containing protein [Ferruginibacter sp.]
MNEEFYQILQHPFKFRLFLLKNLPSAFFSGVRVEYADLERCIVSVPYKWFSKNPFKSTYFACLSMAAEMSTGVLAMASTYNKKPGVSMLVTKIEGKFFKKATGITTFTCEDGKAISSTINHSISSGMPATYTSRTRGVNKSGEVVAEFIIEWSFKSKNSSFSVNKS